LGAAAVRYQHSDTRRDEEPRGGGRDAGKYLLQDREVSVLKVKHPDQEADCQRYEDEATGCSDRSG
jgi:hypothetical protein